MLKGIELSNFCREVGAAAKRDFRVDDGGDLCWTLVEERVIDPEAGVDEAARIVAQHILQA